MENKIKDFLITNKIAKSVTIVQRIADWASGQRYTAQSFFDKYLIYVKDDEVETVYKVVGNNKTVVYQKE